MPYYSLRRDCLNYIEQEKLDYSQISGGFCLYGNRKYIELGDDFRTINSDTNCRYFIYSNISNLDDTFANELMDSCKWKPIKYFEKGFVKIIIYERIPVSSMPEHDK